MEFDPFPVSLPALVALVTKAVIFVYARYSRTHNLQTRLFLWGLFALAIQDLVTISHFYSLAHGRFPVLEFTLFYAAGIMALAIMLHLALRVALENRRPHAVARVAAACYVYAATLLLLLVGGEALIQDFVRIDYTMTRIPGPAYGALEFYVIGGCLSIFGLFTYGALRQDTGARRAKNALLLAGTLPGIAVIIVLFGLLHFDIRWVNAAVTLPLALTVFLIVSAYAIYQHRIFDIQLFIPWSSTRRRKSAFHQRVRRLINEIAELPSANQIIQRLADTLSCPVALLAPNRVLCAGDTARDMSLMPAEQLASIDQIMVANEIAEISPQTYRDMKRHGVAAIVPFYPHSETVSGWLLLGDSFNDQVHSPLDFRLVEELFGKMSELFLDRFVTLRSQLRSANRQVRALNLQAETLRDELLKLNKENEGLRQATQAIGYADSLEDIGEVLQTADSSLAMGVTFVGRDKRATQSLRKRFRVVKSYVSPDSKALLRRGDPELLVCRVKPDDKLERYLHTLKSPFAALLYGECVPALLQQHRDVGTGGIIDAMVELPPEDILHTRVQSLMYLHRHTYALAEGEQPLIGVSPSFTSFMQKMQIYAGFEDPVLILYDDIELASAAATYLHQYGERQGELKRLQHLRGKQQISVADHTVAILNAGGLDRSAQAELAATIEKTQTPSTRFVLGCRYDQAHSLHLKLKTLTRGFHVNAPRLHERRDDIPLLIHYYTLDFNCKSGTFRTLSRAEVRSLKLHEPGWTLDGLRRATVEFLVSHRQLATEERPDFATASSIEAVNQERSLEELVAEFESRIIKQTLERCDGNKSRTARTLGLRPNTLHYKLERYGLSQLRRQRRSKS